MYQAQKEIYYLLLVEMLWIGCVYVRVDAFDKKK